MIIFDLWGGDIIVRDDDSIRLMPKEIEKGRIISHKNLT